MVAEGASDTAVVKGRLVCGVVYLAAAAVAVGVGWLYGGAHPLVVAAAADLAGTVVVFAASVVFDNSSMYDPYWSVAPVGLAAYFAVVGGGLDARGAVVMGLVGLWSVRLTWNFLRGWKGLDHEDWRYRDIRGWSGWFHWPASFVTIHLLPTALVFGGCLALYAVSAMPGRALGALDGVALAVTASAIWIEATADRQLRRFVRSGPAPEAIMSQGLWAYSRHPNYFGEILFWWGLLLFAMAAAPQAWWVVLGPGAITALFLFVSIPLIDARMLKRRPGYAEHRRRVSRIVPWFPRRP